MLVHTSIFDSRFYIILSLKWKRRIQNVKASVNRMDEIMHLQNYRPQKILYFHHHQSHSDD